MTKAELIEEEIKQFRTTMRDIESAKIEAVRWRNYAMNQIEKKAKKLGDKLSEFRTQTMPFMPDGSIPAKLR